ncbi:MAG: hypothetical protein WA982_04000 [Rubrobacteraceae bacterium]
MIPRGAKFAHVALMVFSALLAFLIVRAMDEEAILGASARVLVENFDDAASSTRVAEEVEAFADAHDVNVGHEVGDLRNPGGSRHLYLAIGDPKASSSSWIDKGYPGFSRDFSTEVHPLSEIGGSDPRGFYLVFGPPESAKELLAELKKLGLSGEVYPEPSLSSSVAFFGQGGVLWCFLVVSVASAMVIGSTVVLNAKAYGVLRLQGKSFAQILGRDMIQLGAFWVQTATIVALATVACLAAYNGLDRLGRFGLIAAGILVLLTMPALAAHVLALALTYRTRIAQAIKGEVSASLAMVGAYAIRIPAALLALAIFVSAITAGQDVAARQASWDAYAEIGDASTVWLTSDPADRRVEKEFDETVGSWIRQSESRGEVVLAVLSDMADYIPMGERIPDRDVLIVNNTYLAEHSVLDASGSRLHGVRDLETKAQILAPESLLSDESRFVSPLTEWLKSEAEFTGVKLEATQVETLATKSGQSIFTYGSGMETGGPDRVLVNDPIIVVVPGNSGIFDNTQYASYAVQSGVIFKDPDDVRAAMSNEDIGRYVLTVQPVAQRAAEEYQDLIRELRLSLFNVVAALAVLLITSISVGLIYRRGNAQALFVKYISGWTFVRAYRSLLALEGTLALVLVAWITWNTWNEINALRALKAQGIPPVPGDTVSLGGWVPAVMLAIALLGVVVVIVTVLIGYRSNSIRQIVVED